LIFGLKQENSLILTSFKDGVSTADIISSRIKYKMFVSKECYRYGRGLYAAIYFGRYLSKPANRNSNVADNRTGTMQKIGLEN
jgi:hypothetical protein